MKVSPNLATEIAEKFVHNQVSKNSANMRFTIEFSPVL